MNKKTDFTPNNENVAFFEILNRYDKMVVAGIHLTIQKKEATTEQLVTIADRQKRLNKNMHKFLCETFPTSVYESYTDSFNDMESDIKYSDFKASIGKFLKMYGVNNIGYQTLSIVAKSVGINKTNGKKYLSNEFVSTKSKDTLYKLILQTLMSLAGDNWLQYRRKRNGMFDIR